MATLANPAYGATFNFSFMNQDGPANGTVSGLIELPDGDGTNLQATSVIIDSAPSLGYTLPFDVLANPDLIYDNSFNVTGGNIQSDSRFEVEIENTSALFGLNPVFAPNASYLTDINNPDNLTINTGVLDSDSSTLLYSAVTTPEPVSLFGILGVGVVGFLTRRRHK